MNLSTRINNLILLALLLILPAVAMSQTLSDTQMQNARATGYAIVAARNPGQSFSIYMIPWDGVNTLEYNANHQINTGWHAQAAIKGNYFTQSFDGTNFTGYSTVITSQEEFDIYKSSGTQWWIVCSTLEPFAATLHTYGGNVGIGIKSPAERLAVNGNIRAREIKVENTNWPDYVFAASYRLRDLKATEQFIKENKHLPEMPSAKEVEKNGISLGEMDSKLLKKIEELTLYIIGLNKKLEDQQTEIRKLKAK